MHLLCASRGSQKQMNPGCVKAARLLLEVEGHLALPLAPEAKEGVPLLLELCFHYDFIQVSSGIRYNLVTLPECLRSGDVCVTPSQLLQQPQVWSRVLVWSCALHPHPGE